MRARHLWELSFDAAPDHADRRRVHDLFERNSRLFGPDDARRVGFSPFSLHSLRATVEACLLLLRAHN